MNDKPSGMQEAISRHRSGQLAQAAQLYEEILSTNPDDVSARHLFGVVRHQLGYPEEGLSHIGRAIASNPDSAVYFNNYGAALQQLGRSVEALACFERAVNLDANYVDAIANLGLGYEQIGHPGRALVCYDKALQLDPGHFDAVERSALLLQSEGRLDEAICRFERAIRLHENAKLHSHFGNLLVSARRVTDAIAHYERAITLAPDDAVTLLNLGGLCTQEHMIERARECFEKACRLRPNITAWKLRRLALVPAVFNTNQDIDEFHSELNCNLDVALKDPPKVAMREIFDTGFFPPFSLAYHGRNSRPLKEKFGAVFAGLFSGYHVETKRGGPIRVGVVVTEHHEGIFFRTMRGIFANLSREKIQPIVICSKSIERRVCSNLADLNVAVVGFPHRLPEALEIIKNAGCDVLFYREICSDVVNWFLPQARLAPVQCTALTTQITSGLSTVDFFLSSELIEPPNAQDHYTEQLWLAKTLPRYEYRVRLRGPATRSEFGLPEGANLYFCLQNLLKIHPDFDPLLRGILAADPKAVIVLLQSRVAHASDQLNKRFEASMKELSQRIIFLPRQPAADYMRLLSLADVVIDPPHFGAGITTYDIFSLNLPLVAIPGEFSVSRYTLGCYRKMQFEELLAYSSEEFVKKAVCVGSNADYRRYVRGEIALRSDTLFEDLDGVREIERFFEDIAK